MGTGTLTDKVSGTITVGDVNDIHSALKEDFVPRNSSGAAENLAGNLGTPAYNWNEARLTSVVIDGESIGTRSQVSNANDVLSGKTRSTSNQPAFLTPAGSGNGASITLDATGTDFVYKIATLQHVLTADITESSLTLAPSTNNTCLINDADASDQHSTRTWGEYLAEKESITVDTMGTEISSLVGTFQAFSINNGTDTEYFLAYIASTTSLSYIKRGYFFDENLAPVNRIVFSNNDTITLMSLAYLFIDEDETNINTTYNSPKFSGAEPSSPSTGDYWFDISNDIWKVYNGSAFVASGDTFIGLALLDDTDCLAARCVDFAAQYSREINISIDQPSSSTQLTAKYQDSLVNVAGKQIKYFYDLPMFDITTDLATSADMYDATEQASRRYYLYVTDSGQEIISDVHPYYEFQKFGFYHPHNPWRAIGYVDNNGSSNFARNDMFKAVLDEQYVDEYSFLITATDSYSVGSNQDLVFDSSVDITGSNSMASATSPNFIFTKRGWYQHTFFISGGTTSGSATIDMDLYNTTKSTVHFSGYPQMIFPQTTSYSLRGVYSIPALFEIRDIDSSYKIRISVGTGTVDVYDYISYFRRFKGLHL